MGSHLSNLPLGGAEVGLEGEAVVKLGQGFSGTAHLLQCVPFEVEGLEYVEESSVTMFIGIHSIRTKRSTYLCRLMLNHKF